MYRDINNYLFKEEEYAEYQKIQLALNNARLRDEDKTLLDFLKARDTEDFSNTPEGEAVLEGITAFGKSYGK